MRTLIDGDLRDEQMNKSFGHPQPVLLKRKVGIDALASIIMA